MKTPLIFLISFLFTQQIYAQDKETELENIQINCVVENLYDLKSGKSEKATSEFSLNIVISNTLLKNGKLTGARAYGSEVICDDFFGSTDRSEIKLKCENKIKQKTFVENLTINRLSGGFDNIFIVDDDIKAIFYGTCTKAEKLF